MFTYMDVLNIAQEKRNFKRVNRRYMILIIIKDMRVKIGVGRVIMFYFRMEYPVLIALYRLQLVWKLFTVLKPYIITIVMILAQQDGAGT